jgi:hypothetical protein
MERLIVHYATIGKLSMVAVLQNLAVFNAFIQDIIEWGIFSQGQLLQAMAFFQGH